MGVGLWLPTPWRLAYVQVFDTIADSVLGPATLSDLSPSVDETLGGKGLIGQAKTRSSNRGHEQIMRLQGAIPPDHLLL